MWSAEALKAMSKTELEACLARFCVPFKKKEGKGSLMVRIIEHEQFVERCRCLEEDEATE